MGLCKLCGQEATLVRSHVIPLAFHRHLQSDATTPPVIIGSSPASFPRRSPGGIYDEELMCDPCEQRFGTWDQYGAECLLQRFDQDAKPMVSDGEILAYQMDSWDEKKLRMFALSLLWRASVTANPIFKLVQLGPYQERLRQLILAGDPGPWTGFSVLLSRWLTRPENAPMASMQMSPYSGKLEGINMTKIFLGGFVVYIKTDQRSFVGSLHEMVLAPGRPVYAVARQLEGGNDLLALRTAIERYRGYLNR